MILIFFLPLQSSAISRVAASELRRHPAVAKILYPSYGMQREILNFLSFTEPRVLTEGSGLPTTTLLVGSGVLTSSGA